VRFGELSNGRQAPNFCTCGTVDRLRARGGPGAPGAGFTGTGAQCWAVERPAHRTNRRPPRGPRVCHDRLPLRRAAGKCSVPAASGRRAGAGELRENSHPPPGEGGYSMISEIGGQGRVPGERPAPAAPGDGGSRFPGTQARQAPRHIARTDQARPGPTAVNVGPTGPRVKYLTGVVVRPFNRGGIKLTPRTNFDGPPGAPIGH